MSFFLDSPSHRSRPIPLVNLVCGTITIKLHPWLLHDLFLQGRPIDGIQLFFQEGVVLHFVIDVFGHDWLDIEKGDEAENSKTIVQKRGVESVRRSGKVEMKAGKRASVV
jgi:hypothetical protein